MSLRAAIYARVSSDGQRERHTIASQLSTLPAFAAARGWEVVGTYVDDGRTAKAGHLEAREAFTRLLRDAERRAFDIVLVVDLDRLTRSEDLVERGQVLGTFQRAGVSIAVASSGQLLDLTTSTGDLFATLQAFFAAEENRKRRDRTVRGKLEAIARGKKPAGPTPYGYRYDRATGTWSLDPERAEVVREIFRRVAGGESCEEVARDLRVRGVPRIRGGQWSRERVWQIVVRRTYLGEWVADKRRALVVPVPPIVTAAEHAAANAPLEAYGLRGLRKTKHVYLLEQLGHCGLCGAPIGIQWTKAAKGLRSYYICSRRRRPRDGEERCKLRMQQTAHVDGRLWTAIVAELQGPELEARLRARAERNRQGLHDWQADLRDFKAKMKRAIAAEEALVERFQRGLVSPETLDKALERSKRERAMLADQVAAAERALQNEDAGAASARDALAQLGALREQLGHATPEERRDFVRAAFAELVLDNEAVRGVGELGRPAPKRAKAVKRSATVHHGDAFDLAEQLGKDSIDLVITSPPYWGHRSYGRDHNWNILREWQGRGGSIEKAPPYEWYRGQGGVLGLEPVPEWYIAHLVEIMDRIRPAVKKHGSIWINIGDTYFARWASIRENGRQGLGNNPRVRRKTPMGGYRQEKQLLLIPSRFAMAMQDRRWILRNDLIWCKPNIPPRPEADRLRLAHEHFFHFVHRPKTGRAKYFYDATAVEPGALDVVTYHVRAGRDGHTATFPLDLIRPRILSSCPEGGTVLDPFCGTGSALAVAVRTGRSAIGFEASLEFSEAARRLLATSTTTPTPTPWAPIASKGARS